MKSSFIRGLWGIYDNTKKCFERRKKIDNDIKIVLSNPYTKDFMTYVFGEDNYKYLVDKGLKCKLIDKKPIVWDMEKEQFRHKLEIFKCGMEDFDEIVFLDWDCLPVKEINKNFWETLRNKK